MSTTLAAEAAVAAAPLADPVAESKRQLFEQMSHALQLGGKLIRFAEPVACTIATFWGAVMHVTLPEVVSTEIALSGAYEKELTIALISLINPGAVVFDIGAHRGYFTLLCARLAGPTGQVHAFEPTPASYELLVRNTAYLPQVRCNNLAVYSESKELVFHDYGAKAPAFNSLYAPRLTPDVASTLPITDVKVQGVSIDDYVRQTGAVPGFVKIDAESAERDILAGMAETMREHHPYFTLETGDLEVEGASSTRSLIEYACSFGYRPVAMDNGQFQPHPLHDRYGFGNLLFVPAR